MTNVQAKARTYARQAGALFLPLGFDVPQAAEPYIEVMRAVRRRLGTPDEVWCATGSGMLARCLGAAFPEALVTGVSVGLASRHDKQHFVRLIDSGYNFSRPARSRPLSSRAPSMTRKRGSFALLTANAVRFFGTCCRKMAAFW